MIFETKSLEYYSKMTDRTVAVTLIVCTICLAVAIQACTDANEIAGKGPFSIVVMGGANAEAAA